MIIGTTDDDTLTGVAGDNIRHDEFYGYHGNDMIDTPAGGASWIEGGTGNDTITGGVSEDRIRGQEGDDTITGGAGNDVLTEVLVRYHQRRGRGRLD